ncbi:efflux RND transporter permease subunit [Algisphaera agarilytica]|uniref:Multidrug efflux pump subunit AcrB n=1 Tax=Algisphaera agarilytica TaxID=1385975 RepID=A0A7X0LKQ0_9BACT|nr:efflux RND transporter permease subunit [Algisphaera agarilytica]MBB6429168.1 multidrug efflux pump subunit AcrB [Algisphaera agarilytica]
MNTDAPQPTQPTEEPARGIATLFFRNRYLLWLSIAVIGVAGLSAILNLPRLEDPRIVNRGPLIVTAVPGANAERVEALVTEVLEEALDEIETIKHISSTSRAGVSVVSIELADDVHAGNNEQIFAEVRDKVRSATPLLPPEAQTPVVDDKREAVAFTLLLGVTWDGPGDPQLGVMARLADELGDQLRNLPGTELVRVYGEPQEEIVVEVDRDELAEAGIDVRSLAQQIGNADAKRPAGTLRGATSDLIIEVDGELDTLRRVASLPIATGLGDSLLTVGDLATVERGWQSPEGEIGLYNGQRTVFVAARVGAAVQVTDWAAAAYELTDRFAAERGPSIRIDRIFEQEPYTTTRLRELVFNLLAGAVVIILAVMIIMGLRSAVIVCAALPLTVALVMFGWQLLGVPIHQMSVFGLIIALGLLIDNAIVMTDEVFSRKAQGDSSLAAVGYAVGHLFLPLLASTITTVLAFAPILLLPGGAGDFVGTIGLSVILAICASFLVAMTITASLAGLFTKPTPADEKRRWYRDGATLGPVSRAYPKLLRRLYAMPIAAIFVAAALPFAGFAVAPTLGSQFFPPVDRNMFELRLWMPSDTAIHATLDEARAVEQTLRTLDGVEEVSWLVGGSHPTVYYNLVMDQDRSANYAQAAVTTTSAAATRRLVEEAQQLLDEKHPGAQILTRNFGQGPPVVADLEYRIYGPDITRLQQLGDDLRVVLQKHPQVLHTQAAMPRGEPKLFFNADEDAARLAGLSLADIGNQLEAGLEGGVSGSILESPEAMPVRVRFPESQRAELDDIASSPLVVPASNQWVNAASLGRFELRPELGGIARFDGRRTNTVSAYTRSGSLPIDISNEVMSNLSDRGFVLPAGYRLSLGGASEQSSEANANLARYAPILVVMMVATLILTFRSIRMALILGGVAFSAVGLALLATWCYSFPVSFNMILGTLGLIGVALNDSIVVLAALKADPRIAQRDLDATVQTVVGCTRHIISTTATTVGGFLPLLVLVGGAFWPQLAIVLVGGIIGATLVALIFVPAAFLLLQPGAKRTTPSPAA